ncbi:MAG: hypothetical protein WCJ51_04080 [Candidatus Moraniibacteriota bacterium]
MKKVVFARRYSSEAIQGGALLWIATDFEYKILAMTNLQKAPEGVFFVV